MKINAYTKDDTSRLKGIGILLICLHNFFHWQQPSPGENEFDFYSAKIFRFFDMFGAHPDEFFNLILSYFGHFGVQMFIFLSGYGLAVSMMKKEQSWGVFVVNRWKKLYPLLLTGVLFYIFFAKMLMDGAVPTSYHWRELGYKFFLIHTLIPEAGLTLCGPWWFFGLIFQLYLLFPLLFKLLRRYGWRAFAGICVVAYGMIFLFREAMPVLGGSLLMENSIAHLPEFCLGIWLCLNKEKNLSWIWLVFAVALFCLGNFFSGFYPFTFLSFTVITVFIFNTVSGRHPSNVLSRLMMRLGGISMALFAVHGFMRTPFLSIAEKWGGAWGHFCGGVMFFIAACLLALAAKYFYGLLLKLFDKIPVVENRTTAVVSRCAQIGLCLFAAFILTYYIVMNVAERKERQIAVETDGAGLFIDKDVKIMSLVDYNFSNNSQWVRVKGGFDLVSKDTQATLPLVVMDIDHIFWQSFTIPAKLNDGNRQHYEFEFDFKRPFVRFVKNKPLKVYLWNNNLATLKVDNIDVKLEY